MTIILARNLAKKAVVVFTMLVLIVPIMMAAIPVTSAKAATRKNFKGIKIAVDPGHGGKDGGALAPNRLTEKFINLSVSKYLAAYLKKAGAKVVMTRKTDKFVSLPGRAAIANRHKVHRFVSVHQNSAANRKANGTETYFYHPSSARLARYVQRFLLKYSKLPNRGVRQKSLAVIRRSNMKGVLTEASFISNPKEAAKMKKGYYRKRQALAIFNALKKELGVKDAPKPKPKPKPPKPLAPAELKVHAGGKVSMQNTKTSVHIPYATGADNLISITNISGELAKPKVIFNDALGKQIAELEPFLRAKTIFSFYPKNLVGEDFIGSIDIIEPMGTISPGSIAALMAE